MEYYGVVFKGESLSHHGIKGMKWGVRRFQNPDGSLTPEGMKRYSRVIQGDKVNILETVNRSPVAKALGRINPDIKERQKQYKDYKVTDKNGQTVGTLSTNDDPDNTLNVVWVSINSKHRGSGYGTSVMKSIISDAKKRGKKAVTLEVPGNSPDARHIYEKLGFKEVGDTFYEANIKHIKMVK